MRDDTSSCIYLACHVLMSRLCTGGVSYARNLDPRARPRGIRQLFQEATSPHHQLVRSDPGRGRYLACGLLLRGDVVISEANAGMMTSLPATYLCQLRL